MAGGGGQLQGVWSFFASWGVDVYVRVGRRGISLIEFNSFSPANEFFFHAY